MAFGAAEGELADKIMLELTGPGGAFEIGPATFPQGMPGEEKMVTTQCFKAGFATLRQMCVRLS